MVLLQLAVGAALAGPFDIKRGTMELGGRATANIVMSGGITDLYLDLSPTVGYFVGRDTELIGGLSMLINEGSVDVGFFGGLDYFLKAESVRPYVGGTLGYSTGAFGPSPFDAPFGDVVTLSGRLGLLLPLNRKVGVDLGTRLNVNIADGGGTWVTIPLGYLGVRAFF